MLIISQTNIWKPVVTKTSTNFSNNATLTNPLLIYTSIPNNNNQPTPSIAKTTTINRKDIIMSGTFKIGDADIFNN